jgi:oxygen-independent coproporphyrinogen-3 oxidase
MAGESPAAGRESLDAETRRVERVLLETRLADGLPLDVLDAAGRRAVAGLIADGLVDAASALSGTVRLTRQGRLLADAVVRRLLSARAR